MKPALRHFTSRLKSAWGGFSLVEMMACVSIIGIIAFMAIPSITRMRMDGEKNLAITRAEALNMAQSTFIQVNGRTEAAIKWNNAATNEAKYTLLKPYLSYPEDKLSAFFPAGYNAQLPGSVTSMNKTTLTGPSGNNILY